MSHFEHPPVEIPLSSVYEPERAFVGRAHAALEHYADAYDDFIDGKPMRFIATPRVDIDAESFDDQVSRVAVRLVGTPTFSVDKPSIAEVMNAASYVDSAEFVVIELQYGLLEDDNEFDDIDIEDDDFSWQPYVAAIIDINHPYGPMIVDAQTGHPLDGADLMRASVLLDYLAAELESAELDKSLQMKREEPIEKLNGKVYEDFKTEEFMPDYTCGECVTQNVPCTHNPFTLN